MALFVLKMAFLSFHDYNDASHTSTSVNVLLAYFRRRDY